MSASSCATASPGSGGALTCGDLVAWKARLVARETTRLSPEAADYVDRHLAPVAHKIKPTQLDRLVNEAIGRFMPDEVERLAAASWDKRHVTVYDQLVSFTGTMTVAAELDIADALDLEAAVKLAPTNEPRSAPPSRWTSAGPKPSATSPAANNALDLSPGSPSSATSVAGAEGAAASGRPLPPPLRRRPPR